MPRIYVRTIMSNRKLQTGMSVVFMDEMRQELPALVTAVHGDIRLDDTGAIEYGPCLNLVFVSSDATKRDVYGVQIERKSSVVHRSSHAFHEKSTGTPIGMTWRFIDEVYD